ncbi:hypothetical protein TNCV_2923481 [Trichonephila clavipes]|nr:hypothetical protein TNCV_2923481 [Trichonephila clavipes]
MDAYSSIDITNAYLYANLDTVIYMKQPTGYEIDNNKVYSDFETNRDDRVSMGGFITFIDETPISWRTFKQKSVSLSTMEAEWGLKPPHRFKSLTVCLFIYGIGNGSYKVGEMRPYESLEKDPLPSEIVISVDFFNNFRRHPYGRQLTKNGCQNYANLTLSSCRPAGKKTVSCPSPIDYWIPRERDCSGYSDLTSLPRYQTEDLKLLSGFCQWRLFHTVSCKLQNRSFFLNRSAVTEGPRNV